MPGRRRVRKPARCARGSDGSAEVDEVQAASRRRRRAEPARGLVGGNSLAEPLHDARSGRQSPETSGGSPPGFGRRSPRGSERDVPEVGASRVNLGWSLAKARPDERSVRGDSSTEGASPLRGGRVGARSVEEGLGRAATLVPGVAGRQVRAPRRRSCGATARQVDVTGSVSGFARTACPMANSHEHALVSQAGDQARG